jgi:hypothetical protein
MKEMMKHYWMPTPKKCRRFGDGLFAGSTVLAVGGLWQFDNLKEVFTATELKGLIITSIVLGVIGKFLTNFFKEDTAENN